MNTMTDTLTATDDLTQMKQPKALVVLFLAEMWERFSFYGMRSLLVLYVATELKWGDKMAYGILGGYASLLYLNNIVGGMLADRLFGFRRAILLGGTIITVGHFVLAIPSSYALYLGLALVICGTGLFKGNITAFLGEFYGPNDPRRDNGYTIFYVGINVGSFFAFLACGYVATKFGWHAAFSLAGFGMLIGLTAFILGSRHFEGRGMPAHPNRLRQKFMGIRLPYFVYAGLVILTLLFATFVQHNEYLKYPLAIVGCFVFCYAMYVAFISHPKYRGNVLCIISLMLFMMIFFAFFEQTASSILLLIERFADRSVSALWMGLDEIPSAWFNSFNSIFVITFGPILAFIWTWLGSKNNEPYAPMKFVIAFALQSASFLILAAAIRLNLSTETIGMGWLILFYVVQTVGEVALMPVGFSLVGKLAPPEMRGFFMGSWLIGMGFAQYISAAIAQLTSMDEQITEEVASIDVYGSFYNYIALWGLGCTAVLLILSFFMRPVFKRLSQGIEAEERV